METKCSIVMDSETSTRYQTARPLWLEGVTLALPIALGYIPIGFAFGVLANNAGISTLNAVLMSLLVYAGSSQLIAVGLFIGGTPALSIVLTTLVVNLRHLLMASSLSPYLRGWRLTELAAFGYQLTDETFAVHSAEFPVRTARQAVAFAVNLTAQASWVFGSWLGCTAGHLIPDVSPFGLDFALPAMFIALLVFQLKDAAHVGAALLAGLLSLVLHQAGVDRWNVIFATVAAATLFVLLERRWTKS